MTKQSPGQKMIDLPVCLPSQILLHPPSESYFTFYQVRVHSLPRSADSHVCYLMAMTYLEMPGSALPFPFGFLTLHAHPRESCISCIANYNFDLGVEWLTSKQRRGAPVHTDATHATLLELLEEAFLSEADAHLNSWVDPPTSTLPLTVIKTAVAYAQGHGLACWVREKNVSCGSVVRTERLIEHYNDTNSIGPTSNHVLYDVPPATRPAGRNWAQRWRRTYKVNFWQLKCSRPDRRR